MTLPLPDPNRQPGDLKHAADTNLIVDAIRALEQRSLLPTGPVGPQGPPGPAGADSVVPGPEGPQGLIGPPGPKGDAGGQGVPGATGPAGPQGTPGYVGSDGAQGPEGPPGPKGDPGTSVVLKGTVATVGDLPTTGNAVGDMYLVSATGDCHVWDGAVWDNAGPLQGPKGDTGATGPQGIQGVQGPQGPVGPAGADSTVAGPQGPAGPTGPAGADSVVPGPQGPAGPTGPAGADSTVAGPAGPAGADSTVPGPTGPAGPKGDTGDAGPQGIQGVPGADGAQGPAGTPAPVGSMYWKGDYMPVAYSIGDTVRWQGDLWVNLVAVPGGAGAPAAPEWERAVDVPPPPALDDLTDVNAASPSDKQALLWDDATSKWVAGTVTTTPPDLTPYARKDGAAFTGTVTAPGLAPDAGPSVRNTYFLTAPPDAALGSDGDIAIVVA